LLVDTAGMRNGVDQKQFEELVEMLRENRPPHALVGKGVEVLQAAARSPRSSDLVGEQCTSIVLPCDVASDATAQYHSAKVSQKIFGPSVIEARGGDFGCFMLEMDGTEVHDSHGNPLPLEVPRVGRNQLCPCKSGRKYKKCHGGRGY
jgi:hypothetical protein